MSAVAERESRGDGLPGGGLEFSDFCTAYRPSLVALGVVLCGSFQEAEDAAQQALAEARIRWETIRHPKAYTRQIVIRSLTGSRRWWHRARPLPEQEIPLPGGSPVDEHLKVLDVLAAIRRLPPRQREVMTLLGQHELTAQEIAQTLGVSVNSVHQNIHVARMKLRLLLGMGPGPVSSGDGIAGVPTGDPLVALVREAMTALRRGISAKQRAERQEGHR